ncbi:hypothetical protein [Flammeovirga sp. SJP92]|uniref:hypothetical protein n=1 Tax=Flammeovirga sp. SJP92 TaxID=1775430 RepID=UPI000788B404|nr:hypothetical protein [Flammeovirga sp. SJP92]KXX70404.1 hypothetical protein AVL50_32515 [Flammeovirga sp. SJP92]
MKFEQKIVIDLEEFFCKGQFDFLKLGQTKEWILNNFPNPDGLESNHSIFQDDVWRYGNIELHFHQEKLFLIFSDYINELDGGSSLELKKWFLNEKGHHTLSKVLDQMNQKHIDFHKKTNHQLKTVSLTLSSGVKLGFGLHENDEETYDEYLKRASSTNQSQYQLISFCLVK